MIGDVFTHVDAWRCVLLNLVEQKLEHCPVALLKSDETGRMCHDTLRITSSTFKTSSHSVCCAATCFQLLCIFAAFPTAGNGHSKRLAKFIKATSRADQHGGFERFQAFSRMEIFLGT